MPRRKSHAILVVVLALACGCAGLGRKVNQGLPEFMRGDPGKDEKERIQLIQARLQSPPGASAARTRAFEAAKCLYNNRNFGSAASAFEDFLDDYPSSEYDEEAKFLLGESHFRANDYQASFDAFKTYAESFPVSNRAPCIQERVYVMGCTFLSGKRKSFLGIFSNKGVGEEMFIWIVQTYPNAPRAADAQWRLARYYVCDESWAKAMTAFDFLVKQYPNSEWFAGSRYYAGYTRYRQVKGTYYDPGMVREARAKLASYVKDFPNGQWRADAERLICILEGIASKYLLNVAQWYVDQGHCWSARFYLERLLAEHPGSNAAACGARLLATLPVNPPCPPAQRTAVMRAYETSEVPSGMQRPESGPALGAESRAAAESRP